MINYSAAADYLRVHAGHAAGAAWRNRRLLLLAAAVGGIVYFAVELSDRQGRFDIPSGYGVRMTCEPDPESELWSGGCDRIAADIARTDKPSFLALYQAFLTIHHRPIPSPATLRQHADRPCAPGFDLSAALRGTRYVFEASRPLFAGVCTPEHAEAVMREIDARDRGLLKVERAGLSHAALYAGALANLSEPVAVFALIAALAAYLIL